MVPRKQRGPGSKRSCRRIVFIWILAMQGKQSCCRLPAMCAWSAALQGNSKTGRALYQGHARLWQGESTMDADAIELLRGARVLNATGNVRAVFLQAPSATTASPPANQITKKAQLWYVFASSLSYWD